MEEIRQARIYGVRPTRTFEEAAAKFVIENQHKRSIDDDIGRLKGLMPWIGAMPLDKIHMGSLQLWIEHRHKQGISPGTINQGLQIVRRIVNLAAGEWVDEQGLTWLQTPPKIKLLPHNAKRKPYPLSWEEQARLFQELPDHLEEMALFGVNTGCRDAEICGLRWDYEVEVPELDTSVFIIPGSGVKNGEDRLVVLNRVANSVIQSRRRKHPVFVFSYDSHPITRMLTSAWIRARKRTGLEQVRVHDLKHTFGRRLRAAGVSLEDRQDLLGHRSGKITTHYSAVELTKLIEAANRVCDQGERQPQLVVLRGAFHRQPPQIPHSGAEGEGVNAAKSLKLLVAEDGLEPPTRGL
jgi:integrase